MFLIFVFLISVANGNAMLDTWHYHQAQNGLHAKGTKIIIPDEERSYFVNSCFTIVSWMKSRFIRRECIV